LDDVARYICQGTYLGLSLATARMLEGSLESTTRPQTPLAEETGLMSALAASRSSGGCVFRSISKSRVCFAFSSPAAALD